MTYAELNTRLINWRTTEARSGSRGVGGAVRRAIAGNGHQHPGHSQSWRSPLPDPAYPQERLSFMLKDAQTPVLLTQRLVLPAHNAQTICLDTAWKLLLRRARKILQAE